MNPLLFTVTMSFHRGSSAYNRFYVVAAKDEDGAKAIINKSKGTDYESGYEVVIREIGIAKDGFNCGIIEES
jgi:hypothetical protein|tara:strand:+ start:1157 stop:1372 length:216 start_codon:yes stop_codon:yes gene_type:complete